MWYSNGSDVWGYRRAITIDNTAGTPGAPVDVTITLPASDDELWDNLRSAGQDIRVTGPDGYTLLTFDVDSLNTTTRVGTLEIDGWTVSGTKSLQAFLYFGQPTVSTALTSFVPASAVSGYIETGAPTAARTMRATIQPSGATIPMVDVVKGSAEAFYIDIDFSGILERQRGPAWERTMYEEIDYILLVNVLTGGANQTAMYDVTKNRICDHGRVRVYVQAGTTATDYVLVVQVVTKRPGSSVSRTLEHRARIRVRNTAEV